MDRPLFAGALNMHARNSRAEGNAMQPRRRRFLRLACAAAVLPVTARLAGAQTYPTRPVRIIVPFAAGGPATVLAHLIAQPLSEAWGQSFYVENLPTGASNVGTATAAKANPGKYSYASACTWQSAQLAAELFSLAFRLDIVHGRFHGGGPAIYG